MRIALLTLLIPLSIYASDSHNEKSHGEDKRETGSHKDGEHEGDSHDEKKEGHAEHEEENTNVGPDKGILEAHEEQGIKLAPDAEKSFDIKRIKVTQKGSVSLPKSAIITSGEEVNIFRYRDQFYKRVDFKVKSKNNNQIMVESSDLSVNDEIVVEGNGFLLTAEIAAFGGAPEGHSH